MSSELPSAGLAPPRHRRRTRLPATSTGHRATPTASGRPRHLSKRLAPTALAATLALAYVLISPPSEDLPAHLLRARLFGAAGFGLWNNWWYAGHFTPGYSVLLPPLAALLTPQVVGALAATATAAVFETLARAHFGPGAWLGALWFGAATAVDLYTGRLTFAFGLLPAVATALALQRRRDGVAALLALVTALASPVAALFAALAAATAAVHRYAGRRRNGGKASVRRVRACIAPLAPLAIAGAALAPVLVLAVLFPEGGSEPYAPSALLPVVLTGAVALLALRERATAPRAGIALPAGIALYVLGNIIAFALTSPIGSNADRLVPLIAGPLAALVWWPRRKAWLAVAALPLLYIQWQAPVRDVRTSWNDRAIKAAYYRPLLRFLDRQAGTPFRVEIPFTLFHWEAYEVAPHFALARGWERQLDIKDNPLFYGRSGALTAASYDRWLHTMAVRYVAVARGPVDYSARAEVALIDRGLPYLRLVVRTRDWRVYAVAAPTPLADGPATVTALRASSASLRVTAPGTVRLAIHFNPYMALVGVPGCVAPDGQFTRVTARRAGRARIVMRFSLTRVDARSPRCS